MQLKNVFRKIHLYIGLITGLIIFIVSITGCIWVFHKEIESLFEEDQTISVQEKERITPTEAQEIAKSVFPDKSIHGVKYGSPSEALEVIFYQPRPLFYQTVLINPYDGKVVRTENLLSGFFPFILKGHLFLWLPMKLGSQIVAWSCLLFVIMLISGIILWWPKNKNGRKQRFTFDWKSTTKWKRKNFDLHSVLGFYMCTFSFLIVLTGLIMAFDWVQEATYTAIGGEKELKFKVPNNLTKSNKKTSSINQLLPQLEQQYPEVKSFEIHYPHSDSASIYVEFSIDEDLYYNNSYHFYDQYTLQEIQSPTIYGKFDEMKLPDIAIKMSYDIHIGSIFGIPGKTLAFIISFLSASLPVTGFLLWWGRKKKKNKQ